MALPQLQHHGYTFEDWKGWEGRWELIDGVAYDMTPAPSLEHQRLSRRLERAIEDALDDARTRRGGGDCEVFDAPLDVYLDTRTVVQPDLVVVCDPAKKAPEGIRGAPDLVVEILSPGTARLDWMQKRWAYEAAGVPEYLIVDPEGRIAVLLRLQAGRYEEAARPVFGAAVALLGGRLQIQLPD